MAISKKKISFSTIVLIIFSIISIFFFCIQANADSISSSLKSKGVLTYQDGDKTVVIDSSDFYTLAAQIDLLNQKVG